MSKFNQFILKVGIVSISSIIFPFLSLILLGLFAKLLPNNRFINTLVTIIVFGKWGFMLGMACGLIIGVIVIHVINRIQNKG